MSTTDTPGGGTRPDVGADPLTQLSAMGVAVWLDDLSRDRIRGGGLADLVRDRSVVGVTTNPSIFQKAITGSEQYDPQLRDLAVRGVDVGEALRAITTADVREACDVLRPVYDATDGVDGRVSIEVDPRIAHDAEKTSAEARALWWLVDRPNLFIKIPATQDGLPAISQALAEGISVNVTLIFSLQRYRAVMEAFLDGLERARRSGVDLTRLGSVASFFVSRVDSEIDNRLDVAAKEGGDPEATRAKELRSQAGLANARLAFQAYEEVFAGARWTALAQAGARPQRPLWASTGVKDPDLAEDTYVTGLATEGVVNTMPEKTLHSTHASGELAGDTVRGSYGHAQKVMDDLEAAGVDYDDVVAVLETEGVEKFETAWLELVESVQGELERLAPSAPGPEAP